MVSYARNYEPKVELPDDLHLKEGFFRNFPGKFCDYLIVTR